MAATTKTFLNNAAPQCEDADLNGFKLENNNLITASGQTLSTADRSQTSKAVAVYAGAGDFYADTGTTTSYVLAPVGAKDTPHQYSNGMRVRFAAANGNTGGATAKVGALALVNLYDFFGNPLAAGAISTRGHTELVYRTSFGGFVLTSRAYSAGVSGFTPSAFTHTHNEVAHSSSLAIETALPVNITWRSVGAVGSGADIEWSALAGLPNTVKSVRLKIFTTVSGATNGDLYVHEVFGRSAGSAANASHATRLARASVRNRSGLSEYGSALAEVTVPVNAAAGFNLYRSVLGASALITGTVSLVGFSE